MTLFPEMIDAIVSESIIGRARSSGKITVNIYNIRDYSNNKHNKVDDTIYGGGKGMLMSAVPIYNCYNEILKTYPDKKPYTIYLSPKGKLFTQKKAMQILSLESVVLLCGHYEGIDQRIIDEIVDEEISIGDYVITGGELAAAIILDAVSRLEKGVLSADECFENESIYNGLLECPHYTKPYEFNGKKVPEVLLSGHHENIEKWRMEQSLDLTRKKRPDLWRKYKNKLKKIDACKK